MENCLVDSEPKRYAFRVRLNVLDFELEWELCEACLRMAFVAHAAGDFGDATILSRYPSKMTGVIFQSRSLSSKRLRAIQNLLELRRHAPSELVAV